MKNPQTREQFNQWRTKWIEFYKRCNLRVPLDIYVREYEKYYIPHNWIDSKKSQLQIRFQKQFLIIKILSYSKFNIIILINDFAPDVFCYIYFFFRY